SEMHPRKSNFPRYYRRRPQTMRRRRRSIFGACTARSENRDGMRFRRELSRCVSRQFGSEADIGGCEQGFETDRATTAYWKRHFMMLSIYLVVGCTLSWQKRIRSSGFVY